MESQPPDWEDWETSRPPSDPRSKPEPQPLQETGHRCPTVAGGFVANRTEADCSDCQKHKANKEKRRKEYPPDVPLEPWVKDTPPIRGFIWHEKLWKHMDNFTKVTVMMAQLAYYAKVKAGHSAKTPRWNTDDEFFASRNYVAKICKCSPTTVKRIWNKLIKQGVLTRLKGTGNDGATSKWYFHGLGFPVIKNIKDSK